MHHRSWWSCFRMYQGLMRWVEHYQSCCQQYLLQFDYLANQHSLYKLNLCRARYRCQLNYSYFEFHWSSPKCSSRRFLSIERKRLRMTFCIINNYTIPNTYTAYGVLGFWGFGVLKCGWKNKIEVWNPSEVRPPPPPPRLQNNFTIFFLHNWWLPFKG